VLPLQLDQKQHSPSTCLILLGTRDTPSKSSGCRLWGYVSSSPFVVSSVWQLLPPPNRSTASQLGILCKSQFCGTTVPPNSSQHCAGCLRSLVPISLPTQSLSPMTCPFGSLAGSTSEEEYTSAVLYPMLLRLEIFSTALRRSLLSWVDMPCSLVPSLALCFQ
jgi:hypothetical protein